jgi:hypothetical protein
MNSQPKVGVLTFHRCINYGSTGRRAAWPRGCKAVGYDAKIIDHQSRRVNFAEWKCAFRPVLPTHVPPDDTRATAKRWASSSRRFPLLPLSSSFDLAHPEAMEPYDIVVVAATKCGT